MVPGLGHFEKEDRRNDLIIEQLLLLGRDKFVVLILLARLLVSHVLLLLPLIPVVVELVIESAVAHIYLDH